MLVVVRPYKSRVTSPPKPAPPRFVMLFHALTVILMSAQGTEISSKLRENLKKGNQVLTAGGIVGKVVEVTDSQVVVDVDRGTKITFEKSSISSVIEE